MVATYDFKLFSRESVNLSFRDYQADINLFASDKAPLEYLTYLVNLYHSDLTAVYPSQGTPGPDGDMTCVIAQMFDRAGSHSVRNTQLLLAAAQFFGSSLQPDIHTIHRGAKIQPLSHLNYMLYEHEKHIRDGNFYYNYHQCELTTWIIQAAEQNPDLRVKKFFEKCLSATSPQDRMASIETWNQRVNLLTELAANPASYLCYLVNDIQHYVLLDYLTKITP